MSSKNPPQNQPTSSKDMEDNHETLQKSEDEELKKEVSQLEYVVESRDKEIRELKALLLERKEEEEALLESKDNSKDAPNNELKVGDVALIEEERKTALPSDEYLSFTSHIFDRMSSLLTTTLTFQSQGKGETITTNEKNISMLSEGKESTSPIHRFERMCEMFEKRLEERENQVRDILTQTILLNNHTTDSKLPSTNEGHEILRLQAKISRKDHMIREMRKELDDIYKLIQKQNY